MSMKRWGTISFILFLGILLFRIFYVYWPVQKIPGIEAIYCDSVEREDIFTEKAGSLPAVTHLMRFRCMQAGRIFAVVEVQYELAAGDPGFIRIQRSGAEDWTYLHSQAPLSFPGRIHNVHFKYPYLYYSITSSVILDNPDFLANDCHRFDLNTGVDQRIFWSCDDLIGRLRMLPSE